MKKVILFLFIAMTVATAYGKTLRVNNTTGSGAPYTTVDDALAAASEGDVIILEASPNSYGDITVGKTVTIQGEGYFRDVNGISQEGAAATEVGKIIVNAEGAKISSLYAGMITLNSNRTIVTRCYVYNNIYLGVDYISGSRVTNCIIHQNFINGFIEGGSTRYSTASDIQITNNIFSSGLKSVSLLNNSVIKRNTFNSFAMDKPLSEVTNSVVENNIGGKYDTEGSNTYIGNISRGTNDDDFKNDKTVKEYEQTLNVDAGAFSGEDPYVLSGIAPGPRVIDLTVPESVEQGEDLQVTVKIGSSK